MVWGPGVNFDCYLQWFGGPGVILLAICNGFGVWYIALRFHAVACIVFSNDSFTFLRIFSGFFRFSYENNLRVI